MGERTLNFVSSSSVVYFMFYELGPFRQFFLLFCSSLHLYEPQWCSCWFIVSLHYIGFVINSQSLFLEFTT